MTNEQLRAELLPCPFCGERASFVRQGTRRKSCIVACDSCGASLETSEEGEHCGKAWNRRAAIQSPEVQELRDALERCRFALEPYDDVKPRDWKTDRENLRDAHRVVCSAITTMEQKK